MIIPVKCFTCGEVLADKYQYYTREVRKRKAQDGMIPNKVVYLTERNTKKTHEGYVMDELRIINMCCRRHMLTHVDIE
jgi:DNA-directed RNA polymerase I, II, and III subunit RPABC5